MPGFSIPVRIYNVPTGLLVRVDWFETDTSPDLGWTLSWPNREDPDQQWAVLSDTAGRFKGIDDSHEVHVHLRGFVSFELLDPHQSTFLACWMTDHQSPYPVSPWFGPLQHCSMEWDGHRSLGNIIKAYDFGELHLFDGAQLH